MATTYKIIIDNRNYSHWSVLNATTLEPTSVHLESNPLQHKLFTGDVFTYKQDAKLKSTIDIIHSPVRNCDNIPAVLILNGNKTFGRATSASGIKGKPLYKCVPDDIRLPAFVVPYEHKHVGFSKVFANLYVTIRFTEWLDNQIKAVISQTIGPVDVLYNFYEYQLYCKSLNSSIQKFTKATQRAIKFDLVTHDAFIESIFAKQEIRGLDYKIFSIDPSSCSDFDDAFSIKALDDNMLLLSIYIANVTILMDALNLWSSFSERIATIYLPDKKRPMLPTILSDCLCSLQAGSNRYALVLDLIINRDSGEIVSTKYSNCLIRVKKNYVYEEPDLLVSKDYIFLLDTVKTLSKQYKYISNVKNSHEVVSYLMILMNYLSAKELLKAKVGIFRSTIVSKKKDSLSEALLPDSLSEALLPDSLSSASLSEALSEALLPDSVPEDVVKFIKIWNSAYGQYIDISLLDDSDPSLYKHVLLDMDAYIHITSPIRRLVDMLNMIKLQQVLSIGSLSEEASKCYTNWVKKMDYINITMRSIKKVQNDCLLLDTSAKNLSILDCIYDGYCFDKIDRNDGLFQYIVYLPELKMTSKITVRENMNNYQMRQYKLFLFNNEDKFKKKIRLHLYVKPT
jgi:exoribonuclease R